MKKTLSLLTLFALFAGFFFGKLFPEAAAATSFLGSVYITFLRYMITPVIFSSIAVSVCQSGDLKDHVTRRAVGLFAVMFTATFLLSSLLVFLLFPGEGLFGIFFPDMIYNGNILHFDIGEVLYNLLPDGLLSFFAGRNLFFVILLSFLAGYLLRLSKSGKPLQYLLRFRDFLYKILEIVMGYTPVAVFSLMAVFALVDGELFSVGVRYILSAYFIGIIALVVVMVLPVWFFCGVKPLDYVKKIYKVWLLTLSTCSSAATLPYTLSLCKEDLGIDEKITDVVVPLGSTIHMCGGAVAFSLLSIFCAKMNGIEITLPMYLLMTVSALLINMAAPGIPGGGVVVGASYLQLLGIPLGFIGFYSGIYKVLDMLYTSLNVTGDISADMILAKGKKS